eukprot:scaffold82128_cov25-Tisochrysis_lutea.AAC.3
MLDCSHSPKIAHERASACWTSPPAGRIPIVAPARSRMAGIGASAKPSAVRIRAALATSPPAVASSIAADAPSARVRLGPGRGGLGGDEAARASAVAADHAAGVAAVLVALSQANL